MAEKEKPLGNLFKLGVQAASTAAAKAKDVIAGPADHAIRSVVGTMPFLNAAHSVPELLTKLRAVLPTEALTGLPKGEFWLPQLILEKGLGTQMPEKTTLKSLVCAVEGIEPTVAVSKLGAAVDASAMLFIQELVIAADRQELTVDVRELALKGTNWLGWIAAPLVSLIVQCVYGDKLVEMGQKADLEVRRDPVVPDRFTVDLAGLPPIQKLKSCVFRKHSVLDFVQVTGFRHAENGLYLKGNVNLMPPVDEQ